VVRGRPALRLQTRLSEPEATTIMRSILAHPRTHRIAVLIASPPEQCIVCHGAQAGTERRSL
jgi:hypothetical protein